MNQQLKNWLLNNFVLSNKISIAQIVNLVPNSSFEKIDSCPYFYNSIQLAQPWDTLKNGGGAGPDLFAECGAVGVSIPLATSPCYQYARSGNCFINSSFYALPQPGIYPYARDYMQSPLINTLQSAKTYCVTFYVNLSNRSKYAIADIGAYFDDGSISTCYICPAIANPQILSPANVYINDTMNWVKIQGSFIASGNESYITLGNFKSDAAINKVLQYPNNSGEVADYGIDDLSVLESNSKIKADNDTLINKGDSIVLGKSIEGFPIDWYDLQGNLLAASSTIVVSPNFTTSYIIKMDLCGNVSYDTVTVSVATGVEDVKKGNGIIIYPNPTNNDFKINIQSAIANGSVIISNTIGQEVFSQLFTNNNVIAVHKTLPKGLYFITIKNNLTNESAIKKLVVE